MQALETLTNATLTRKQFLLVIASLILGLVGLKAILKGSQQSSSSGFGGGVYGGM